MPRPTRKYWEGLGAAHPFESYKPTYDLPVGEVYGLSQVFLELQEDNEDLLKQPYGCYVVHGVNPFANLARHVDAKVFEETFGNTAPIMEEEYGPYEKSSLHFLIMDHQERLPVGSMRVIYNSSAGLKSVEDLHKTKARTSEGQIITPPMVYAYYDADPDSCVDIATAAVVKGHRKNGIPSLLLYRTLYLTIAANQEDFSHILAIMDTKAERSLHKMRMPFKPILDSQPFPYLDTDADQKSNEEKSLSRAIISPTANFHASLMFWQENYEDRAFALTTNNAANRSFNSAIQEIIKHGYIAVDELEMIKKITKSAPAHASRYKAQAKVMRALVRHSYNIDGDNPLGLEEMLSPEILEIGRKNIAKLEKTTPPTDRHLDKAIA
jgi:hypothetical protein